MRHTPRSSQSSTDDVIRGHRPENSTMISASTLNHCLFVLQAKWRELLRNYSIQVSPFELFCAFDYDIECTEDMINFVLKPRSSKQVDYL